MTRRRKPRQSLIDPRLTITFIDSNALDDCEECNNYCVNTLCSSPEDVSICIPQLVLKEINHPNSPSIIKKRANSFVYTLPMTLNERETRQLSSLVEHFRGNSTDARHDNDAHHIFEYIKYGGGYFVTEDKVQAAVINRWVRA